MLKTKKKQDSEGKRIEIEENLHFIKRNDKITLSESDQSAKMLWFENLMLCRKLSVRRL